MNERRENSGDEISIFEIADGLWSLRWLALVLILCAAVWSAVLIWTGRDAPPAVATYEVASTILTSGTPVRSAADIAGILKTRLNSAGLVVTSAVGANPVVLAAVSSQAAEIAIATAQELEEQLTADVQAQINLLLRLMQDEAVTEFVSSQYVQNASFLEGVRTGLISIIASASTQTFTQTSTTERVTGILLPWVICGGTFIALALSISFAKQWRSHRDKKRNSSI